MAPVHRAIARAQSDRGLDNLAAMLGATVQRKRPSESDDLSLQVALVAGARNQHYLQLWRPAA